jgi:hypothetical protein
MLMTSVQHCKSRQHKLGDDSNHQSFNIGANLIIKITYHFNTASLY